jgi:putative Ca2+/H+ antiporter (TMEM165/GDT1 family)
MDWRAFASTFALVFLAELGDKTQLTTLSLSASSPSRWFVFFASALALTASSAVAVLGGQALAELVPPIWIRRTAGALFLVFGTLLLLGRD